MTAASDTPKKKQGLIRRLLARFLAWIARGTAQARKEGRASCHS